VTRKATQQKKKNIDSLINEWCILEGFETENEPVTSFFS
jgi:hypothetical protein